MADLKLTDKEKQEIVRYLEAGKPLPEKYRFLLFEDKREVELVWNGKTNEVCNVVLPFQTIEHVDEIDDLLLPYTMDLSIFNQISDPDVIGHIRRVGVTFYEKQEQMQADGACYGEARNG